MAAKLPYVASPGSVTTALERIAKAATPDRVSKDFVNTKLEIKGGTGTAIAPFLKKIGFVASDGSPTKLYEQFRNPATSGAAVAAGIRHGYKPLFEINEYAHDLDDAGLKGLIVQVTGMEEKNSVVKQIFATIKKLKAKANFDGSLNDEGGGEKDDEGDGSGRGDSGGGSGKRLPMNIGYTINLNLPATTNVEVFNAIFKSLKEHLIDDE